MTVTVDDAILFAAAIVRELFGDADSSSGGRLRFGSISINLQKGTFYDNDADEGGTLFDLVRQRKGFDNGELETWIENVKKAENNAELPNLDDDMRAISAERRLIGWLITKPDLFDTVIEELISTDFAFPLHREVYVAIADAWSRGRALRLPDLLVDLGSDNGRHVVRGFTMTTYLARLAAEALPVLLSEARDTAIKIRMLSEERQAPSPCDDGEDQSVATEMLSRLEVIDLEEVKAQNIDYVWNNRLAVGKHSAIAGIGGKGKSQVLYYVAARISRGDPWPFGEGEAPKGSVVILSAEDDVADMMKPRLVAAGADTKFVKLIKAVIEGSGRKKRFNLLTDLDALYRLCRELGDVVMVGIDPLGSYLGGELDTHRDAALRSALDPISEMASAAKVAVTSIMHFNKAGSMKLAMDRVMGGAGFVNAPRCSLGWLVDPEDETKRLLLRLKTNMGEPQGLRAHLALADAGKDNRTGLVIRAPRVIWDSATEITADAVVAMSVESDTPKLDEAIAFLQGELKDGPSPVEGVKSHATAMGISADTLKRARYKIGVTARQITGVKHGGWEYHFVDAGDEL